MRDTILQELYPDEQDNITGACIAILNIVRAVKGEIGTEKIVVNVRISPEGTSVGVEPWEPYESDIQALINAMAGRVVEIREKKEASGNAR